MSIKRRKKNGRVYLEEHKSVRVNGKVKSIFVRYLGPEDEYKQGKKPKKRVLDRLQITQSHKAGDVTLLWEIAKDLDLPGIIDTICCQESFIEGPSPGKFITSWAINRVIEPESCTQLERWVPTTDIPKLMGLDPVMFTKDAFLTSLDFVCDYDSSINRIVDHTKTIGDTLYQHWRHDNPLPPGDKETVAYDLTSVLFFGVTCPLAEAGQKTAKTGRRQVNLCIMVSKHDKYPIAHFIYPGKRNSSSTVKNLLAWLDESKMTKGTIIWDRGMVSKANVTYVEKMGWKLICAVSKSSKEVSAIIDSTNVPLNPDTYANKGRKGHIYAIKTKAQLFRRERSVVVYENQDRRSNKINSINDVMSAIGEELNNLSESGKDWSEAKLHKEIDRIVGKWKKYIHTRVKRKSTGQRIEWKYKTQELNRSESSHGKYILLSTDESLSAKEIVNAYFEKDFVEKVFRILKTDELMEPVRHRLESRVRAYMFVCVLGYRLLAALRSRIAKAYGENRAWERTFDLLRDLSHVERTEVGFGKEVKTMYLNVPKSAEDVLKRIGMKQLLKEGTRLNM